MNVEDRLDRLETRARGLTWGLAVTAALGFAMAGTALWLSLDGDDGASTAAASPPSPAPAPAPTPAPGPIAPQPGSIPAMLTDEQIAALTIEEARDRMVEIARAKSLVRDEATKQMLMEQFKLLMARVREG